MEGKLEEGSGALKKEGSYLEEREGREGVLEREGWNKLCGVKGKF